MGFLDSLFGGSKRKVANVGKRFDLRGKTGQGSMSKVYQAYDKELGRTVALKLMDKEKTQKFEDRFKGLKAKKPPEGEVCVGLTHPHIVKTFEHGVTTDGQPYLVMEWVEGSGLNALIDARSGDLDGRRVDLLAQLCTAVDYLHGQKFLHRDLCPRNIMVASAEADGGRTFAVKLIDFGLAVPYTPEFTAPGNRTGTAEYLAPEVIKRMATDHRVDLFALGVTAYELFTGQLPWERASSTEATIRRMLNTPPRTPQQLKPGLDDALAAVLLKAIDRERGQRHPTAAAFRDALQKLPKKGY